MPVENSEERNILGARWLLHTHHHARPVFRAPQRPMHLRHAPALRHACARWDRSPVTASSTCALTNIVKICVTAHSCCMHLLCDDRAARVESTHLVFSSRCRDRACRYAARGEAAVVAQLNSDLSAASPLSLPGGHRAPRGGNGCASRGLKGTPGLNVVPNGTRASPIVG
ncbi:hypothetical protein HYPSUDRAFT_485881 [Hypholoma sublateritium FD-334 SS-4]|uniref:Uncharacterized protein n=1 Tax=Hypholoma sublateritium (strain FD-334 SS-4) TaxID=945553 RepID=A0A0D2LSJ6_HYPSF|nr:hypothetical protein HYPSUDRAFT_485881 [Hypholoma sublateritium FD-334 SS-4]